MSPKRKNNNDVVSSLPTFTQLKTKGPAYDQWKASTCKQYIDPILVAGDGKRGAKNANKNFFLAVSGGKGNVQCDNCAAFMKKKSWYDHIKSSCDTYSYSFPRYNGNYFCFLGHNARFVTREEVMYHFVTYHKKEAGALFNWGYDFNTMTRSLT